VNRQIRIVAMIALVLFGALFVNLNWLQLVHAQSLANNPDNIRVLLKAYANERGPIISADQKNVAVDVHTPNDAYKWQRTYPQGSLFADVTGYFSLVYGSSELEHSYNKELTGQGGRLTMQSLSDQLLGNGTVGDTVVLTIQTQLQQVAAAAMAKYKGAVVALDPTTGAILAMVSSPSYDPNPLASHNTNTIVSAWKQLQADPSNPMLNRATSATFPPGSTFKVVTAAAALDNGLGVSTTMPPASSFLPKDTTSPIHNYGGETCGGDMMEAFTISCDVYFAKLATELPAGALAQTAGNFGFGSAPPLELPTAASQIGTPAQLASQAYTAQSGIGQYNDAATPLQMALVASAVADGGKIMAPYLVQEVRDSQGNVLQEARPRVWKDGVMSASTDATLTAMMESVVNTPSGTGTGAAIPGVMVAGKTGTAQNAPGQAPHAWFIAFAPAQAPRIAVAVLVENGGSLGSEATGGAISAPIAKQVIQADRTVEGW
jgi:peptidoglycan glycosyltransferase